MNYKLRRCFGYAMSPFCNRKAIDESSNSGIRLTVGLTVTLMCLFIMLILFGIFLNGAKDIKDNDAKFRQQENDSISFDDSCEVASYNKVLNDLGVA